METKTRLEKAAAVLQILDGRRLGQCDQELGSSIERVLLDRELRELEADILADPGALQATLVPVRMKFRGRLLD
jgi:hypothetical protein